jgi:hypothetical protein
MSERGAKPDIEPRSLNVAEVPRPVIEAASRAARKMFIRGVIGSFHRGGGGGWGKQQLGFCGDGPFSGRDVEHDGQAKTELFQHG